MKDGFDSHESKQKHQFSISISLSGSTPLTSTYANPETSPITTNTPTGSTPLTSTYANLETSPITTNTPTAVAADRACSHQYNSFCYELFYDEKTFAEAHRTCLSLGSGSNLASIADQYENDFLKVLIVDHSSQPEVDYWIGLTNTRYRWFNGRLLLFANFNQDLSNCVVVNGNDFSWKSNPCEDTEIFVCEQKKDPNLRVCSHHVRTMVPTAVGGDTPCSEFEYNGSCYTKSLVPGSIIFAINECSNNGADLLQIETYDEQQFLEDNAIGTDDLWLNLNTTGSNGHSWSDGTNMNYDYFGSEYKQNGGICFRLNRDDGWHWNDDNCNSKHNFVCKWTR
ncbi:putative macrophage mannose receptor 1-like [Apostichopus japonicus]|uniref:Putative macrophage mannose receptor 1-like n=1 Tax=Stichopus japonicus TaxID=307972 RepID=A0A2G8KYC5_STIJA|nr:putative macrophage mannose receptor 1-like [Apostichopus japonicus]